MKFLKNYAFAFWTAVALNIFANLHVWDWKMWAIYLPICALVEWKQTP